MSYRLPYTDNRRRSTAPYIVRRDVHDGIIHWLEQAGGKSALVVSGVRRSGVTRTLFEFNSELDDVRIKGISKTLAVVVDLSIPTIQEAPEFLAETRNRLVDRITQLRSIDAATVDRHFIPFDAIYHLWAAAEFIDEPPPRVLIPARATRTAGVATKAALSAATLGSFEMLVGFVEGMSSLIKAAGFGGQLAEVTYEAKKEGWTDRLRRKLATKLLKVIGPQLSAPVRRALAISTPTVQTYENLLPTVFADAVAKLLCVLSQSERCILVIDAADELNPDFPETTRLRLAICQALAELNDGRLSIIFGAREPLPLWSGDLGRVRTVASVEILDLSEQLVRGSWSSKLPRGVLGDIVSHALKGRACAPAGDFAAAYAFAMSTADPS